MVVNGHYADYNPSHIWKGLFRVQFVNTLTRQVLAESVSAFNTSGVEQSYNLLLESCLGHDRDQKEFTLPLQLTINNTFL